MEIIKVHAPSASLNLKKRMEIIFGANAAASNAFCTNINLLKYKII